jgi:hypothetical protein
MLLLVSALGWCSEGKGMEIKRVVSRQFQVSKGAKLEIDNKYGNIVLNLWNRDEIDFSIEITGKGKNEEVAQEMADRVSIDFNKNGNSVYAQTVFAPMRFKSCNSCGTSVHYTVNIPADLYLELTNKYGNIYLEKATMPFRTDLKYGNLEAGSLLSDDNRINLKYGNMELQETQGLTLDAAYSKLKIGKAAVLNLTTAYSSLRSEEIGTWRLASRYDNFTVGKVGSLSSSLAYSNFHLKYLKTECTISDIRYGKVSIEEIARDFSSIDISAAYTTVRLGIDEQSNFRADLSTRYGNIQTGHLTLQDVRLGNERYSKSLTAIMGSDKNPGASVRITNSYADIILN